MPIVDGGLGLKLEDAFYEAKKLFRMKYGEHKCFSMYMRCFNI